MFRLALLAGLTASTNAAKPTFEIFFGSGWPACKGFAPTLKQVFHEEGIADAVTFKLSPGIRGPEHTGHGYSCVDENNCDHEVYFLCGQANGGGVDYLACMDAQPKMPNPEKAAKTCAAQNTPALDFSKISTCYSGGQGTTLKAAAATYFDKKFPKPVGVPHMEINGVAEDDRTESGLLSKLCATGITAPACKKVIVV